MKKYKIIDTHDRAKLAEGRNFGFGGAFAKVDNEKGKIELVMPLTACGDFYAEVVHTEYTGKLWDIYGFKYQKQGIFDGKDEAYIVGAILEQNRAGKYATFDADLKKLEENYANIELLTHWFEDRLGVKKKTKLTRLEDNRFLFTFDLFWTQGTYKISLYKLLTRMALYYDGKQDPIDFLDSVKTNDAYIWKVVKPKALDMIGGHIPEQVMTDKDPCPHNLGIKTYVWPAKKA